MTTAPTLHSLVEEALAHLPTLSRHLLEATQDELERAPNYFHLLEAWRRLRGRFALDFEAAVIPMLQQARRGSDPLHRSKPQSLDALSLVDERQALQDVAIAHAIHTVEDLCRSELHQLGNFFAALRGTARAQKADNPIRPALFVQALFNVLEQASLDAESRYALMRVAAGPLAQGLLALYRDLCRQLHEAQLGELVASHAARSEPSERRLRFASSALHEDAATLDGLARRVQAHNSRPQGLPATPAAGPAAPAGAAPDMLTRLYDRILADPRLLPPVKALLARLQIPVVRLARLDASLLRREDHPAWRLLNRVAAHGMAFEHADDERLQAFLHFMEGEVQLLLQASLPTASHFQQLLSRVETHISAQAQQRSERSAAALEALEREQMRGSWTQLLREQIHAQIAGAPLGPQMRRFMHAAWVDVIVQAMVLHGRESNQALAAIEWVDQLLASLAKPANEAQREQLRAMLPGLLRELQAGCDSIALPEPARESALQELMHTHAQLMRGQEPALPAAPLPASREEPDTQELLQQLISERESQLPESWIHSEVDRSRLPTVPVPLTTQPDDPRAVGALRRWADGLRVGDWFHMFVQSEWLTAQLAWISESHQYYLFVGQDPEERHSLTRGAIEQLYSNGLITALDESGLVQRAVRTLMQDLRDEA